MESFFGLCSRSTARRWRAVGRDIYRTVGGYVTGNLLISLIAGTLTTIVLLVTGVPYRPRARADRRDPRPDPARRCDDRSDHRRLGRVPPLDPGGDHRRRVLRPLPAGREPHHPAGRLRTDGAALAARRAHRRADRGAARGRPRGARRDPRRGLAAGDLRATGYANGVARSLPARPDPVDPVEGA